MIAPIGAHTNLVVASELRYGAATRGSRKLTRQIEAILGAITIVPLESGENWFESPPGGPAERAV